MIPRIRRAPDYEWLKIVAVIFLSALILAGSAMAVIIWWDTPGL